MRSPVAVFVAALATILTLASGAATLRGGSIWPFGQQGDHIKNGITFERTVETSFPLQHTLSSVWWQWPIVEYILQSTQTMLPQRFQIMKKKMHNSSPSAIFNDGHCQSSDSFGGNLCHYNWNDEITINYNGNLDDDESLDENVYIEMSFKIDNLIHHNQVCNVCGPDPCNIDIAGIKKWTINMPPCPLTQEMLSGKMKTRLPKNNPIPSLLNGSSGTLVEGTMWLKRRNGNESDDPILMKVNGNVHLK